MEESTKTELQERFARLFPNCKLHAIHLDGFSHEVFYKDEKGGKHIDMYSGYCYEQYEKAHLCGDGVTRSFNEDRTKVLFLGYGHATYQHNAKELIFAPASQW